MAYNAKPLGLLASVILREGDRILLCSDGLHGLVNDSAIGAMLSGRSLRGTARELVRSSKRAGGDDNITVIVAQMDSAVQVVEPENVAESPDITLPPR